MLKVSYFSGESEAGPSVVPLHGPADSIFEKTAAPTLLDEVTRYISGLTPDKNSQYVLVNAMGAGEFYGSNINGDWFDEEGLIHRPDDWTGVPLIDKIKAADWTYGFPTFYNAHAYAHHKNKDSSRAYGIVELAAWNPRMRRVELVVRVDKDKCERFGGMGVWDKLHAGQFVDVSMGSKVPWDLCSICTDWDLYKKALQTYKPSVHKHPGLAVLEYHKKTKAIRGLSITRNDYCEHAKRSMNKIFSDGRKVFVHNPFPRFFDISFVFIGADKTAKVMLFIFQGGSIYGVKPSAQVAEEMGIKELKPLEEKTASVDSLLLDSLFGKQAKAKKGEMEKQVVPSQFAGKAIPLLTKNEPELPKDILELLSKLPLEKSLATTGAMGVVLKPKEYQRIILVRMGKRDLADSLDSTNTTFPKTETCDHCSLNSADFMPALARILLPLLAMRSALGPEIEKRVLVLPEEKIEEEKKASSHNDSLLLKISSAYNGYRQALMDFISNSQVLVKAAGKEMDKLASMPVEELFTPLTVSYLQNAYFNELPVGDVSASVIQLSASALGQRGEGIPLSDHVEN